MTSQTSSQQDARGAPVARSTPRRPRRPRPRSRLRRRVVVTAVAAALAPLVAVGALWPLTPSVRSAPDRVAAILRPHGVAALTRLPAPDRVGRAVVATEDSRFYADPGVDPLSIVRAARSLVAGNPDPGGATLDQQLAKLLYAPGASVASKVEQVELALKLNAAYAKPTLLRMYLSVVYFGHGYYGLRAAARGYFGRSPAALTWAQASLLAGLVQAPSAYDPYAHYGLARARQRHVLDRLAATGALSAAAARAAYAAPLGLR
jgi:penicillin-binding protein 1A